MDDAVENLLESPSPGLSRSSPPPSISFIGSTTHFDRLLENSIASIDAIGDDMGRDYEIVLTCPSAGSADEDVLRRLRRKHSSLMIVRASDPSPGRGKDVAFKASTGKFIVPFRTGTVYPLDYADILYAFLGFRVKRLFFTELPLVHRDLIREVGGWRDLRNGEDLDLFSRLAVNYGVMACPTNLMRKARITIPEILGIYYPESFHQAGFAQKFIMARDLIIACNYTLSDLRDLYRIRKKREELSGWFMMFLAYLGSRAARIKPIIYDRNNLVVLMESILESLVLKEYTKIPEMDEKVFLQMDRSHIEFISDRSKLYRDMKASLSYFLRDQI